LRIFSTKFIQCSRIHESRIPLAALMMACRRWSSKNGILGGYQISGKLGACHSLEVLQMFYNWVRGFSDIMETIKDD